MDDFTLELVKEFLVEAFDLIDNLERSLLELEKNPSDDKAINEVFRAAHTIKGGAGTVGFNEIQELTHLLEDVLDLVRKKTVELSFEDLSLLLSCKDELEKMLSAREKQEVYQSPNAASLMERLKMIKSSVNPTVKPVGVPKAVAQAVATQPPAKMETPDKVVDSSYVQFVSNLFQFSNSDFSLVNEALVRKDRVFIIVYELNENYEMKDVSAFQVYALLNDVSEILRISPPIEMLENDFYKTVGFVLSTEKEMAYIKDKTNLRDLVVKVDIRQLDGELLKELENQSTQSKVLEEVRGLEQPKEAPPVVKVTEPVEKPASAMVGSRAPETPAKPSPDKSALNNDENQKRNVTTLRVESWKVDELLNLLGELVITKATFTQLDMDFDRIVDDIKSTLKGFLGGINQLNLGTASEENSKEKNEILRKAIADLFASIDVYSESMQKLNRVSSSLQENVMNMRMVPIQMVFSRFPRLIRDMSEKVGKNIELIIEGVETEIDKGMVDDLFDPLIHLLRNSVDHGVEKPEDRVAAGKNEKGRIILKAVHEGDSIVIEVSDDGRGINIDAIKKKAVDTGFITAEVAEKIAPKEALALIFMPGLSTAKTITDISGRGVGMDVVKKKIEEIGGSVGISTVIGKGTRISIRLPLTLAIIQGLLIIVNGMHYVIPVASVNETVIVKLNELKEINGRLNMELREKFIPIMSLKKFFYGEEIRVGENVKEYCIVAKYGDGLIGILVNEVIGEQDIVIKPLNTKLIKSPGISAATIIGNGEIGYIVDTSQIINHYFKSRA